ncbi:MAG: DUF488 domain-containing protein [Candidatus Methanofastidiosum sp.]|nr:DUF488 domain-containing protein [Methanofastidiosum sp.]
MYTIGHSNRSIEDFVSLLKENQIGLLIDVRTYPYSKYVPHFDMENLKLYLTTKNIDYEHHGKKLGGKPPIGFENYRNTQIYREVLIKLINYIEETGVTAALMCSEKDYTKCHRRLLAEDLQEIIDKEDIAIEIFHIVGPETIISNITEKQNDNPKIEDYFIKEDTKVIEYNKEYIQTIKKVDDTNILNKKKKGKKKKEKNTDKDLKLL